MKRPVLAWVISLFASAVFACECGWVAVVNGQRTMSSEPPPLSTSELKDYTAVFSGTVESLDVHRIPKKHCDGCFSEDLVVTFQVSSSWKGVRGGEFVVRTPRSGAACGYGFELGQEYLVYVQKGAPDFRYGVDSCSRTKKLALAVHEIEFLEDHKTR